MPVHDIIVMGASAGGVPVLQALVHRLPADLPAAVGVVLHIPAQWPSQLPAILTRAGPLRAHHAETGEPLVPAQIYVAPPNWHLLLEPGQVALSQAP